MLRRLLLLVLLATLVLLSPASAATATDPGRKLQWNLDKVGAEAAWKVADGSGVIVAVVDSGADLSHEDLAGRFVPGHDFVDGDDNPQDANGHGTHVSGIIGARTGNGKGIAGVAPGVRIMPVRVLDDQGRGTLDNVVAGVRWAVAHGAKVINLSLGNQLDSILGPSFANVLREAWDAGVVPVVAAGNDYIMGSGFSDEPAMVVAATDRNDGSPSYSNGVGQAKWGIAAPGGELPDLGKENAILSTYWGTQGPNEYAYLAGTSQAAPHVAAAVAILLSTGRFTPAQAVQRLLDTAVDIGPPGRDSTFGAGRLDIAAAVRGLTPASSPAPPATTVAPTTSRPVTTAPVAPAPSVVVSQAPAVTLGPIPRHAAVVAGPLRARHDGRPTNRALPAVLAALLILAAAAGAVLRRGAT